MMSDLPETLWGPLWRHMHTAHGLLLLDDECNQIAHAVDECRNAESSSSGGPDYHRAMKRYSAIYREKVAELKQADFERGVVVADTRKLVARFKAMCRDLEQDGLASFLEDYLEKNPQMDPDYNSQNA